MRHERIVDERRANTATPASCWHVSRSGCRGHGRQISMTIDTRTPSHTLAKEAPHLDPDRFAQQARIGPLLAREVLDECGQHLRRFADERLAGRIGDDAARDDLRRPDEPAVVRAHGDNRQHDAIAGQVSPIPDDLVGDLTHARVVDQDAAGRRLPDDGDRVHAELHHVAVLRDQHVHGLLGAAVTRSATRHGAPGGGTRRARARRTAAAPASTSLRSSAAVPRQYVARRLGDHLGARPGRVIDDSTDALFVAGNRPCRQHDRVAGAQLHVAMVVDGDSRQRRSWLSLRSGRDAQHVLRRERRHVRLADLHALLDRQVTEPERDFGVLDHSAPDEGDLAAEPFGEPDQDLNPMHARRKRRDDEQPRCGREDLVERAGDLQLRAGDAGTVDVRAVGEERQTPSDQRREAVEVEVPSVERRVVDLEVAGARWSDRRESPAPASGMLCVTRRNPTTSGPTPCAQAADDAEGDRRVVVFTSFGRQASVNAVPNNRSVDQRPHVWHAADGPRGVRQHERRDAARLRISQIRHDEIDAGSSGRKHRPASMTRVVSHETAIMFMPNRPAAQRTTRACPCASVIQVPTRDHRHQGRPASASAPLSLLRLTGGSRVSRRRSDNLTNRYTGGANGETIAQTAFVRVRRRAELQCGLSSASANRTSRRPTVSGAAAHPPPNRAAAGCRSRPARRRWAFASTAAW